MTFFLNGKLVTLEILGDQTPDIPDTKQEDQAC